eukprot:TRINITY_DN16531_c0_g1_i1.p1 TRINITY_DN16531_c0_g1~~TRINITY_DN16531_c0_g1_i1.p1  ORF type:complete len:284 (+),score=19.41 TRINITY_DN16531_c0_g1_i1:64-915(+)
MVLNSDYENSPRELFLLSVMLILNSSVISVVSEKSSDCSNEILRMVEAFGTMLLVLILWERRLPQIWKDNSKAALAIFPAALLCGVTFLGHVNISTSIALTCIIRRKRPCKRVIICFVLSVAVLHRHVPQAYLAGVLWSVSALLLQRLVSHQDVSSSPSVLFQVSSFMLIFHFSLLYLDASQRIMVLTDGPFFGFSRYTFALVAARMLQNIVLWIFVCRSSLDRDCGFMVSQAILSLPTLSQLAPVVLVVAAVVMDRVSSIPPKNNSSFFAQKSSSFKPLVEV